MYPHRRGGFEFMWNNIAGDINLERLRKPLSESKGGCIISPPPVEFQKWAVDIPFHNLNNKDFSLKEDEGIVGVFHHLSDYAKKKFTPYSVLGISYDLFRILTGENGEGYAKEIREILLKFPGLLFLEGGHTARNEHNLKHILMSVTLFQNNIKEMYTLCVVSPKFDTDLEQKWASLSNSIDKNV
ncbi:hypothetical protein R3W88_022984 [Solanum pinnatisectum]|uniref:Uncharacterized protein n=1 Tax=Solanum pinnatisectum TaxID=50273 RepID=A0AAV9LW96_9SOLN|nr:hypothetical protein R3W88_022984 [Solanum pinnatisectum]